MFSALFWFKFFSANKRLTTVLSSCVSSSSFPFHCLHLYVVVSGKAHDWTWFSTFFLWILWFWWQHAFPSSHLTYAAYKQKHTEWQPCVQATMEVYCHNFREEILKLYIFIFYSDSATQCLISYSTVLLALLRKQLSKAVCIAIIHLFR